MVSWFWLFINEPYDMDVNEIHPCHTNENEQIKVSGSKICFVFFPDRRKLMHCNNKDQKTKGINRNVFYFKFHQGLYSLMLFNGEFILLIRLCDM